MSEFKRGQRVRIKPGQGPMVAALIGQEGEIENRTDRYGYDWAVMLDCDLITPRYFFTDELEAL